MVDSPRLLSNPGPGQVKGEGQVRVRRGSGEGQEGQSQPKYSSETQKLKDLDLSSTLFLVFTYHHPPPTHQKLFSWLLRGLDMSDGPRMGWYDSIRA